ncbi:TetR/AcrR family transcriptional regulator [Streptomyces sp. NPDC057486]|uniref:TetR/AcrR family transcriptional regulator n=1 Tax=Streptomyces sp. NPDC057486 TaxID=3346145 RepID=UPI0036B181E0
MSDRRTAILESAARVIARRGVRGLRVEELAAEANVSKALIYYHFEDRADLLRRTLAYVNNRAERYTTEQPGTARPDRPLRRLERALLLEFQDIPHVRENSTAWGELRASAVFDPELRGELALADVIWVREVADCLGRVQPAAPESALTASAERLTALLEGLSTRWLSDILPLEDARARMRGAIEAEVAHLARHARCPVHRTASALPSSQDLFD